MKVIVQLANHTSLLIVSVFAVNRLSVHTPHWPILWRRMGTAAIYGITLLLIVLGWLFIQQEPDMQTLLQAGVCTVLGCLLIYPWLHTTAGSWKKGPSGPSPDTEAVLDTGDDFSCSDRLAQELRGALDRGELMLHYQPQFSTESRHIRGFEALLRWHHPKLGFIPPDAFIPIAEQTGLIVPIGEWVLREACTTNRLLQEAGVEPFVMCVNISAVQLQAPFFAEHVLSILKETGHSPEQLELEITESKLIDSWETALHALNLLHTQRVRIALDDFGTGYSSLSYLRRLPIHLVKIDRSFVEDMLHSSKEKALVESIILLARSVGIDVLAEGIETEAQLECLRRMCCDCVQGYLLGKPMDREVLWSYMQRYRQEQFNPVT
ncbi:putative bifunctional diguanylate cyclase/phosphodiesterase [Paenibacillus rigui]|uniref:putative bifunctional diguanylate cyclase/phosphodiesterase n=1 Tax=Paenibacillus rigui TaxID=554312 RepID=UPI001FE72CDE|nr:EAL domain-containing protein [Paenibacillus rigui]